MEQVKVRDYQTKHFDVCPVAVSLYKDIESKGVNMEDAEAAARVQDGLFALEKKVIEKGEASHNEVARAIYLQDIIMDFAEKMELESEHSYVQGHVDKIKSYKDSVNEEEGFSFDKEGKPVEKNLDQALKDLFARIKKELSDEDKKKLEGAIQEAINSFNETVELGKNLTEELCAKGKAYIKKRKAAGEKSSAYLSGRAVKVCKGQMKG